MSDWIRDISRRFARRLVQEAEMQEQSFAQGECPNCGHDWTAHGDFIARGEKVCWTYDIATLKWQRFGPPPVIPMEDPCIHTVDNPFCGDMTCPCHLDRALIREHLVEPSRRGLLTWYDERVIWKGRTV